MGIEWHKSPSLEYKRAGFAGDVVKLYSGEMGFCIYTIRVGCKIIITMPD